MERLRQFEVVCRVALQLQPPGATMGGKGSSRRNLGLSTLGRKHFDLNIQQAGYCAGRARFDLEEIRELDRARNRRSYSGAPPLQRWQYLDNATSDELRWLVNCAENADKAAA